MEAVRSKRDCSDVARRNHGRGNDCRSNGDESRAETEIDQNHDLHSQGSIEESGSKRDHSGRTAKGEAKAAESQAENVQESTVGG